MRSQSDFEHFCKFLIIFNKMHADYFKIFELVKDGNLELITELLESYKIRNIRINISHKDVENRNLLHWACYDA